MKADFCKGCTNLKGQTCIPLGRKVYNAVGECITSKCTTKNIAPEPRKPKSVLED
jgi:hypothetical protein